MADIAKIVIPDSVRLAQYDAKSSIDDVAQNLSSKYKQFADEIKKVIETILKQNIENENQISFRLANKILEDERETLQKFLNDETFSPDIDELVTEACEKASTEIYIKTCLTKTDIEDLKAFLLSELKKVSEKTSKARESIINEIKGKIAESQPHEDRNEKTVNDTLSFETFDGIRYFTGWLTASFIKKFETNQIAAFNSITQSINSIESLFKNMNSITDRIKTVGGEERIKETVKSAEENERQKPTSPINLGNSFGARTVTMIMSIRNKQTVQNKMKNMLFSGLKGIGHGLINAVESIEKSIAKIGVAAIKKTVEMSEKFLKVIKDTATWSINKIFNNIVGWSLAAALIWKFWLSDNFKKSITSWISNWTTKINEKLKIDKFFKYVKNYFKEKLYNRYAKKFIDHFKDKWGAPIEHVLDVIKEKIKPIVEWIKGVKISEKFSGVMDFLKNTWIFTGKVLQKPFSAISESGENIFNAIKEAGNWLWNLMTGKLTWEEAGKQFSKGVWHPLVDNLETFMLDVTNFTKINANWIMDFFGMDLSYRFSAPVDKNGNRLTGDKAKSIFEKFSDEILDFGKDEKGKEIVLDAMHKLIIKPKEIGKGIWDGGIDFTWVGPNGENDLKIPGVEDLTKQIEEITKNISAVLDTLVGGAITYTGGLIGAWAGRLAGLLLAPFTGFASVQAGAILGNIIGSLIGYYFFDSMNNAKEYFSAANENIAERLGVSKEAENTLSDMFKMPRNLSRLVGTDMTEAERDMFSSTMGFRPVLRPIKKNDLDEEDQKKLESMGFNEDVSNRFNRMFSLISTKPKNMNADELRSYTILTESMAPKNIKFFDFFDNGLEPILQTKFGKEDLGKILTYKAAGPKNLGKLMALGASIKENTKEWYEKLTKTGHTWTDMILQYMIEQNSHLSFDEFKLATEKDGRLLGDNKTGKYKNESQIHWALIPIIDTLMSIRMALVLFQTKIQKEVQKSISLFNGNLIGGENALLTHFQEMLINSVYNKNEEQNKSFAENFLNNVTNLWYNEEYNLLDNRRILYSNLMKFQKEFLKDTKTDKAIDFFNTIGGDEYRRIENIISVFKRYSDIMINDEKLKKFNLPSREKMSEIFDEFPKAIELFFGFSEMGEAFTNEIGEPSTNLDEESRAKALRNLFSLTENSLITAMNDRMAKILEDFDDLYENDNAALMDQLSKLLAEVNDSDWENKILGRINSGLAYKEDYEALSNKIVELRALLAKRGINYTVNDEGKYIIILPAPEPIGKTVAEDSQAGFGTMQTPASIMAGQ